MEFVESVPRLPVAVPYMSGSVSLDLGLSRLQAQDYSPTSEEMDEKGVELDENSNFASVHSAPPSPTGEHNCPRFRQRQSERRAVTARPVPQRLILRTVHILRTLGDEVHSSLPLELQDLTNSARYYRLLRNIVGPLVSDGLPSTSTCLKSALMLGHYVIRGCDVIEGRMW
eukprot:scpid96773/ scgid30536/ 